MPGHVWTCVHACAIVVFVLFSVEVALPCTEGDIPALLKWFSFHFSKTKIFISEAEEDLLGGAQAADTHFMTRITAL